MKLIKTYKIRSLITLVILLVIWEISAANYPTLKFFISSPSQSFVYALENFGNLFNSTLITTFEAIIGFIIAVIFSFIIMLFCLFFPKILEIILPIFVTSQVLPIITLAPLFIIIFGMGLSSKVAMVVLMCFFPIFINFSGGIKSIPREVIELLDVYNAGRLFRIFKIYIPLSTSHIFNGLKISTTMAIMGAIVAEFVGAKDGLGKNLYLAPKNSLPELMICSIFLTVILGWVLYKLINIIEKQVGEWYLETSHQG